MESEVLPSSDVTGELSGTTVPSKSFWLNVESDLGSSFSTDALVPFLGFRVSVDDCQVGS